MVVSVEGHELLVGALFDDVAFFEDVSIIGVLNGGEAVCDDDGGASFAEFVHGFANEAF